MNVEAVKAKLKTLWNGDVPLAQTFWQYYLIAVIVLGLVGKLTGMAVVALLAAIWAAFMVMPIWRAAGKYTGKPLNALLAKIAAVIVGLGALGNLLG